MRMKASAAPDPEFGFRLARVVRRLRQALDAELRGFGLTEATWRPLAYVGRLGEGVRQKELAAALGIEGPSLVRLLDGLERRGLIVRREEEGDRRARGIFLTPSGRDLQKRVLKFSVDIQARILAGIPADDLDTCDRVMRQLDRALDREETRVPPQPSRVEKP